MASVVVVFVYRPMQINRRRLLLLGGTLLLVLLWQSPVIAPLKLLVVFLHELSHALATWLTGGRVVEFVVTGYQSGHVISAGGSRFIILSAGYLGSLLFGLLFYRLSRYPRLTDVCLAVLALTMLIVGMGYAGSGYTLLFAVVVAVLLLLLLKYANASSKQALLLLFALATMLYVPMDIFFDTLVHNGAPSDARMLANDVGGTTILWGSLWFITSLYLLYETLRKA